MSFSNFVLKGLIWSSIEKVSVQIIQFIVGIILARLLTPSEYGIIGILLTIIAFMQVFIDSGFSKALIQLKDRQEIDYSTVFLTNGIISIFCYVLIWYGSSLLSEFYNNYRLISYTRVIGIVLIFNSLFVVPNTILTLNLNFKILAKINTIGNLISGIIAIFMAFYGFNIWALIYQQIIRAFLLVILSYLFVQWKPHFLFSILSFKRLFSFGSKLLYGSLLGMVVNNISNLFIAKLASTKDLGFYNRGTQFTDIIYGTTNSVLESVLLPIFSNHQDDIKQLAMYFRIFIRTVSLLIVPIFFLLAFLSKTLVLLLLTEKWLPVVPIMQIFCFARLITIIAGLNVTILNAIGRSDLVLKQQLLKIFVRLICLILALKFGIIYIAIAELFSTIIHFFINTYYPGRIMKINSFAQLKAIFPMVFSGCVMILVVAFFNYFIPKDLLILQILTSVALGIFTYILMIKKLMVQEYEFLYVKLKEMMIIK